MKNLYSFSTLILLLFGSLLPLVSNAQTISGPDSVCVGDISTYSVSPTTAGASYNWTVSSEGNELSSGSSSVIQWTTAGNATLILLGTDTSGTPVAQDTLDVVVNEIPLPNIIPDAYVTCLTADTVKIEENNCIQVCEGGELTYTVENLAGAIYNWSVNGEQSFSTSGNTCTVTWGDVGYGSVNVEVVQGSCTGIDLLCVEIIEKPEASFSTYSAAYNGALNVCKNTSILFFNESTAPDDSPIVSWVWNFGDGTVVSTGVSSADNPLEHSYSQSGTYQPTLIVTNACGCTDSYSITVNVSNDEGIQIECPRMVCEGDTIEYTVDNPNCTQSSWEVLGGGQIISQNSETVTVVWDDADEFGFGYLKYTNECGPCAGKTAVKIPIISENAKIQGPDNVCANSIYNYSFPQWPSTRFDWSLSGDASMITSDQTNIFSVLSGSSGSFTVKVHACNSLFDCESYDSLTVNISPQAFIVGNQESCTGLSNVYSLSNDSSASWTLTSPSGVITEFSNVETITPTFTESGIYTLEITGDFCSPDLFLITVHVKPPQPEIIGPDYACVGVPTQYSTPFTPGVTTLWGSFTGTATPENGPNTSITFNSLNGGFNVIIINKLENIPGCSTLWWKDILPFVSSINLTTDAPSDTICGSSQWSFDSDYTNGDLYQWEILDPAMGSIVAGDNSPHIEVLFNNPQGSSEDVDVVVAVTICDETLRDTLTMHVINTPIYTATPGDTTICAGVEVEFNISPTPGDYESLTWDFGDGTISNLANVSYAFPNNTSAAEFNPVVTIVNPEGCPGTSITLAGPIEVIPAPVALISPSATIIGCDSISELLSATVSTGFGSTTNYEWFGPLGAGTPPNCSTCNTWTVEDFGEYSVVVENSNGCSDESNTVLIIENCEDGCPGPKPFLVSSDSAFISCATVEANIQYNANGTTILSEDWVFPGGAVDTSSTSGTTASAEASFKEAGVYVFSYVVSYGNDSCAKVFQQDVYVPFVGDMKYTASCGSGSLYDITLFDQSNVFPSEVNSMEHEYAVREVPSGVWETIDVPLSALSADTVLAAGEYEFREIISSGNSTAPACTTIVSVNLPDKPDADFEIVSPFEPACINDVVIHLNNLSTPASGLNYVWSFGGGITNYQSDPDKVFSDITPALKTIALTATSAIGCIDSTQNSIEIEDNGLWDGSKPSLSLDPSPPVCVGTPIELEYFNFGFSTPTGYTWYQGSNPITPVVTSSTFNATQEGEYWVMGSDEYGCLVPSNPAQIYFTPVNTPTIIGNPAQCDSVPFTLTSSIPATGVSLEWERSPGGVVGTATTLNQVLTVGTYTYTLTATQNGCEGVSVPYVVTVASPADNPTISFDITSCEPYVVELTATNSQSGIYNWNNGSTGSTVYGYTGGGVYEVYFTSDSGCTSTNSVSVPSSPQEYMWHFPTGCYCEDDFPRAEDSTATCAGDPFIDGPKIPFAQWSYQANGVSALAGSGTSPSGFADLEPDSINLILNNGFCTITSDAMYISEDCADSSAQGIVGTGNSMGNLEIAETEATNQTNIQLEPEIRLIPNPAAGQTRIQYRFDGSESQRTIEVYDMTGRKVNTLSPQNNAGIITLQLGDFRSGIYQVCLRQDGRIIAQSKLSVTP